MIRTAVSRSQTTRFGVATLVGLAGAIALAGCASPDATGTTDSGDSGTSTDSSTGGSTGTSTGTYVDGTYTADGSYSTPESVETIAVTITLADGVITDVTVEGDPQKSESEEYQGRFIGGIADVVVGQSIDEIQVSRVAGSSLTSGGFNKAIEIIKSEATA
ncbi:FMN-binding protein [Microbacterium lacus]|uniref:hypothetical protein n=1 Tax=Microbacterium lacus TaxID=415217 RepID=UPI00384EF2B8